MPSSALQAARWNTRRRRGRTSRGRGYAFTVPSVTFPTSPLTARIYIALGADLTASWLTWNWLDITPWVRYDLGVNITVGRRDESTRVSASSAILKLDNRDGRFSRRNPTGPYFGQLTKNTPIWIQLNPGSGFSDCYFGYVNEWPTRWFDASGTDSYVTIRCAGVMRRLAQGENIETSLNRTILADSPVHYWRVDDPSGSPLAVDSAPNGGIPLSATSGVVFSGLQSPPGGDGGLSAPILNDGGIYTENMTVSPPWTIEWSVKRPSDGTLDGAVVFSWYYYVGSTITLDSATVILDTSVSSRDWYHYVISGQQNGANYEIYGWKNGNALGLIKSAAGTLGALTTITAGNLPLIPTDFGIAYIAVYNGFASVDAQGHSDALQAYSGEMAHERVMRLCTEAGVPVRVTSATSAVMGPQSSGTLLDLLRECEIADQGVLYEHEFGLAYQSVDERYNQPVAMTLDFDSGHIAGTPEPADDDQRLRNQWTVSRSGGLSVTARDTASVAASGLYDDMVTANLETDDELFDHAAWRVHVGTVDEDRWPRLPFQLHRPTNGALIPAWLATPLGSRINVTNPPAQMAPDAIDAIIEGYTERFDQVSWDVSLNATPASPYTVAVVEDSLLGRLDSASSTVAVDFSDSALSFTVSTTNSTDLWTTDPAEFPMDIRIAGEKITLSSISGASSPQTFNVSARSVNGVVKAQVAGAEVHVNQPAILAL